MKQSWIALVFALSAVGPIHAQSLPCLLTKAELASATGRSFENGVPGKDLTGMKDQCVYAQQGKPQRPVVLAISRTNAKAQFASSKRLLQSSKEAIDIPGVGEGAYFSGVAAGVLTHDTFISLHGLRRASDPKIERDKVAELLKLALSRLR